MVLKALMETNDREIFEGLVGSPDSKGIQNTFLTDRVELLLRTYKTYGLYTMTQTRAYLGEKFRPVLGVPDTLSNYEVGTEFLRRIVLVHLGNVDVTEEQDSDKFRLLLLMIRKLYALVAGDCAVDNPDAVQNQEILLGGFLYGQIIKERLDELISSGLRLGLREYFRKAPLRPFTSDEFKKDFPIKIFQKTNENVGNALEYFLSTGNLSSPSGLDLQQVSGFTVVAEKLNFLRFISHFPIPQLAAELGVVDTSSAATDETDTFRYWKVEGSHGIPLQLEIGHVPASNGGSYPGIYMSTEPSRMVRSAKYLPLEKEDCVGTLEQPYMSIACTEQEIVSGRAVQEGDVIFAYHTVSADYSGNLVNRDGVTKYEKYKDSEQGFIEEVRIIGSELGNEPAQTISIKFRIPRSPIIGDKFSSRHGQKGVCSQKWPAIDMPFSESGIQPDIIINPHAFPSRMTIGMFVESLAGKAGALHGLAQDSTPFRFDEDNPAADYFGHQLMKAGYNYHGNEPMYSGITGEELAADIYIGVVYYQRLRHMANPSRAGSVEVVFVWVKWSEMLYLLMAPHSFYKTVS
ncbi:hypothetical protein ONZ43_g236 [Nemania bipapillata]|uniref:Uncharacterized protein n=1 Tax=Nemania bipapillata TaxID=110536 RepID=A0ACC2J999_9PEZI|nr:hypothetical protein ONZ43_g236 [Nemania bipapillata]